MKDDDPKYESRGFDPEAQKRYVMLLLDQLATAERKTDPALGTTSEQGKDHEAFSALLTAGELVRAVAGWALDHVYGLSLLEEQMQPRQPNKSKSHEEYKLSREAADRHEHERAGSAAYHSSAELNSFQKRAILRNLLFAGSGGFSDWLRVEGFNALDGLSFGETHPIFAASIGTRRKVAYRELRAQLAAVALIRFAAASGQESVGDARERVAAALCVAPETMRDWEKKDHLPKALGRLEVDRTIELALNAASHVKRARDRERRGIISTEEAVSSCEYQMKNYGLDALARVAAEYKEARKTE